MPSAASVCSGDRPSNRAVATGCTDVSDRAGHVPADVVVSRSRGDRDAGLHLEACDERLDGELAGDSDQLARRGNRRPQRSAAVDGGPIGVEGVVEVQHVCGDAVGQRRLPGRAALPSADDACGT